MTGTRCDNCDRGLYQWDGFGWYCDFCGDQRPNGLGQFYGHIRGERRTDPLPCSKCKRARPVICNCGPWTKYDDDVRAGKVF
jgi:hypothetical protein